jgi:hypothetical protein
MKKVFQKEFYYPPEMWCSNRYVVLKPHKLEAKGAQKTVPTD